MLNETFRRLLPPGNDDTVSEYILADRLMSFNTTTGTGWFDFGSYNETLKGNCQLTPQTDAPSKPLAFNICMSLVTLLVIVIMLSVSLFSNIQCTELLNHSSP